MKILQSIDKETKAELRKVFSETKKQLNPHMKHINFSNVDIKWWLKEKSKTRGTMGWCYKGKGWIYCTNLDSKRKTAKYMYYKNLILLNKYYAEHVGKAALIDLFKHELIHLIARDGHGPNFKYFARSCGVNRHCEPIKE